MKKEQPEDEIELSKSPVKRVTGPASQIQKKNAEREKKRDQELKLQFDADNKRIFQQYQPYLDLKKQVASSNQQILLPAKVARQCRNDKKPENSNNSYWSCIIL